MRKLSRVAFVSLLGVMVLASGDAGAGQFKQFNVSGLALGGQAYAYASPQNRGAAMEMDVYEYFSAATSYRCRIFYNNTGRQLTLARLGVNGAIQATCTTPVNGTCDLPYVVHAAGLLFQCLVATGNGSPVTTGSIYGIAIQRNPAGPGPAVEPGPSGLGEVE